MFGARGALAELSNNTPIDDGPRRERRTVGVIAVLEHVM
jgi:hypothetical protein